MTDEREYNKDWLYSLQDTKYALEGLIDSADYESLPEESKRLTRELYFTVCKEVERVQYMLHTPMERHMLDEQKKYGGKHRKSKNRQMWLLKSRGIDGDTKQNNGGM